MKPEKLAGKRCYMKKKEKRKKKGGVWVRGRVKVVSQFLTLEIVSV